MSDEQEKLSTETVEPEEKVLEEEQPETIEEPETPEEPDMEKVLDNLNRQFGASEDDDDWKKGLIAVGIITAVGFIGGLLTGLNVKKHKKKEAAE